MNARTIPGRKAGHSSGNGYVHIGFCGRRYLAHRVAFLLMEGEWPPEEVDHKNRIRDDNRWSNLRRADRALQCENTKPRSAHPGVTWDTGRSKWQAHKYVNGRSVGLGRFDHKDEAVKAVAYG